MVDISAPEISLNPTNVTWECGTVYTDLGVSARDAQDGTDLTALIQVVGLVPELAGPSGARPGTYAISYTVSRYPGGNSDSKQRIASVIDSESPVIVLNGLTLPWIAVQNTWMPGFCLLLINATAILRVM